VYGDHVELSAMTRSRQKRATTTSNTATILLPRLARERSGDEIRVADPGPKYKDVTLTAAKEERWKKWIGLYNQKMLSKGEFRTCM